MIKTKIQIFKEALHGYKRNIHYIQGARIKKESWYTVRTWPKHRRMGWVRNRVYGALDVLGKNIIKLRDKV